MSDARLLRAFAAELVAAGVTDAIVCPGSRSTPLALALRTAPGLRVRVLLDERAAGFFALGLARTSGRPVILLATSGTAAAEFHPAVVEAEQSRVPLVVLTADRPPELRDRGAPQTIDQERLYGRSAKWYVELPLFDGDPATEAHVRSVAGRAVATAAAGPAGPVQLNVPFREPLVPDAPLVSSSPLAGASPDAPVTTPFTSAIAGRSVLDEEVVAELGALLGRTPRGLIVAGPDDDPELPAALVGLAPGDRLPDPRRPAVRPAHGAARPVPSREPGRPARPSRAVDRRPPAGPRHPDRRDADVEADRSQLLERVRPGLIVIDGDGGWREPALPARDVRPRGCRRDGPRADRAARVERQADVVDPRLAGRRACRRAGDGRVARGRSTSRSRARRSRRCRRRSRTGRCCGPATRCPCATWTAWLPSTERAITRPLEPRRQRHRRRRLDRAGRRAASTGPVVLVIGDVSFVHDLDGLVSATAPRPRPDDRAGQQRRRRHLLVPAPGAARRPAGSACRSGSRSCSGRRTASTSRRSSPPWAASPGRDHRHLEAGMRRLDRRGRACGSSRYAPTGERNVELHRDAAAAVRGRSPCRRRAVTSMTATSPVRWAVRGGGAGRPVLLLHGFSGPARDWDAPATTSRRVTGSSSGDLPGHGGSDAPPDAMSVEARRPTWRCCSRTRRRAGACRRLLPGRARRAPAGGRPSRRRRIAWSSRARPPGIEDAGRRADRRAADEVLAARVEATASSVRRPRGSATPCSPPSGTRPDARAPRSARSRLANDPAGLAASLRGAGQGAMAPLHDEPATRSPSRRPSSPAPWTAIGRHPPERVAAAIPGARLVVSTASAMPRTTKRPEAFRPPRPRVPGQEQPTVDRSSRGGRRP